MQHAVIYAHPRSGSFTATVARTYAETVRGLGHEAIVRDLYGIGFDPCLKAQEIPGDDGYRVAGDTFAERQVIQHAEVFVLVYPFWFNAAPAILKGYVDRVFSMEFGYEPMGGEGTTSLLDGRRLVSFTSSGAPDQWVQDTGALALQKAHFDRHLAAMCGLVVAEHVHFAGLSHMTTQDWVDSMLEQVREAAKRVATAELAVT